MKNNLLNMSNIGRKIIVVVLMLASMMLVSPQSSSQTHGKGGWQDKMKAERVALSLIHI